MKIKRKLILHKLLNKALAAYFQHVPFEVFHLGLGFRYKTGRKMNIRKPKKYGDKIQWIKLNYRNELIGQCNDKVRVRDYVKEKGYGHLLNEVIGIYKTIEEIDFDSLPVSFAMRANHGSSWNIICHDKAKLDWEKEFRKMDLWVQ